MKIEEKIFSLPDKCGKYENEGQVYIAYPNDILQGKECPLVLAFHGSGRNALSYREVPFYRRQRDLALSYGYIFAAVSNGPDTYGTPAGLYNTNLLLDWVRNAFPTSKDIVLWGSSAGGVLMHRFFCEHQEEISFLLGVFPIFDLSTMHPLQSELDAFSVSNMKDLKEKAKKFGLLPQFFPQGIYYKKTVVISHGVDDAVVPISQSYELSDQVKRDGGTMFLAERPGGHSTENMEIYNTFIFDEALKKARK